jgi:DinB family protein
VLPPPVAEPFDRDEILRDLAAVRAWSADFWRAIPGDAFFAPIGDGWSPADHVRHLVKSNRPVAMALGIPRFVLRLRFGGARTPSKRYSELVATYHAALGGGLKAGRYAATPLSAARQTPAQREESLALLDASMADVIAQVGRWSERALDRLRLPHPGLGPLTVREMVLFTLYHNTHHVMGVARGRGM